MLYPLTTPSATVSGSRRQKAQRRPRPAARSSATASGPGSNLKSAAKGAEKPLSSSAPLHHRLRARPEVGGERRREAARHSATEANPTRRRRQKGAEILCQVTRVGRSALAALRLEGRVRDRRPAAAASPRHPRRAWAWPIFYS